MVLTGKDFPDWSARANATVKLPLTDLIGCNEAQNGGDRDSCAHNHYEPPEVDTAGTLGEGTPTDRLLGYRWDEKKGRWRQIPFQVDEQFTRYLDNSASGFAVYSGEDKHTTYAFDREGWRFTQSDPDNPCLAATDRRRADDAGPGQGPRRRRRAGVHGLRRGPAGARERAAAARRRGGASGDRARPADGRARSTPT